MRGTAHLPIRIVSCSECSVELQRKCNKKPLCSKCRRKRWRKHNGAYDRRIREEARRYRIILVRTGFDNDQFEDLLEEIRGSHLHFATHAETRLGRLDEAKERRTKKKHRPNHQESVS